MTNVRNPGKRASSGRVCATISCAVLTRSARGFMRMTTRAVFIAPAPPGPLPRKATARCRFGFVRTRLPTRADVLVHLLVGRPLRRPQADVDRIVVLVRMKPFGTTRNIWVVPASTAKNSAEHDVAVAKSEREASRVPPAERAEGPIDPGLGLVFRPRAQQPAAQHGRERHRHQSGDHDRRGDRDGELSKQPPQDSAQEQDRNEDGSERHRHAQNREADLTRAVQRRTQRLGAFLEMAHDVLEHHDRIVHDEPEREDQGHQRHVVEAEIHQPHHHEGAQDRERQGEGRDERRRRILQEQKDDEDDEDERRPHGDLDVLERRSNRQRAVGALNQVNGRRELSGNRWQQPFDRVDHRERVAARLLLDRDQDGAPLAIRVEQPRGAVVVLDTVDHRRDLLQPDRRTVVKTENHRAKRLGVIS